MLWNYLHSPGTNLCNLAISKRSQKGIFHDTDWPVSFKIFECLIQSSRFCKRVYNFYNMWKLDCTSPGREWWWDCAESLSRKGQDDCPCCFPFNMEIMEWAWAAAVATQRIAARTLGVRAAVNPERVTRGQRPRQRFEGSTWDLDRLG